ncbi:DUF2637 domain-containing protein [Streptomyces sp. ADMS]|uniref:DUF2637 domain-containing protein n=1 Tax=Streptomyces sp. ADMS TaxID=3071415 RepID=UPI00296FAF02|nr:DUF2637 domain-containing protein [Streptomyces sp. ADMS]MDW4907446.1 DUF2637 domain-containing protein [Streptomyces sp. ADMS]
MNLNRKGRAALVLALVAVVAMAFRVSWNALRDIAGAVGADDTAATLYPFVVDGLMALALVAALVLDGKDRRFALRVLGAYTLASLVLNYVHGLVPELHDATAGWGRLAAGEYANWVLVLLATSLPVGSIYFGSDLVAKVLHHRPDPIPDPIPTPIVNAEESTETVSKRSMADLPKSTPAAITEGPVRIPDPVAGEHVKSALPLKSVPAVPASIPVPVIEARVTAAESTRPRRATGRLPAAARPTRSRRTPDQLLAEARKVTAAWPDAKLTAEGIRLEVHTSPANARMLRDALKAERAATAAA